MEKSCGILYELLQVCLQTRWPEADKTSLVITKVVDDIIKLPGSVSNYHHSVCVLILRPRLHL